MTQTGEDAGRSPSLGAADEALTQHKRFQGCVLELHSNGCIVALLMHRWFYLSLFPKCPSSFC